MAKTARRPARRVSSREVVTLGPDGQPHDAALWEALLGDDVLPSDHCVDPAGPVMLMREPPPRPRRRPARKRP